MKHILSLAFAAATCLPAAHAADALPFYVGATIGTTGQLKFSNNTESVNSSRERPFKVYGGYELSEHIALEAGYTHIGKFKFPGHGQIDYSAMHIAAKAGMKLGESFSIYGKLGAARQSLELTSPGDADKINDIRPMIAVGSAWRFSERLSLTLEVTSYGRIKGEGISLRATPVEVGLRYAF